MNFYEIFRKDVTYDNIQIDPLPAFLALNCSSIFNLTLRNVGSTRWNRLIGLNQFSINSYKVISLWLCLVVLLISNIK